MRRPISATRASTWIRWCIRDFCAKSALSGWRITRAIWKALRLRIERLKRDPAKDQAKLLEVLPFWRAWQRLLVARPDDREVDGLRWLIEELRVSLFAQELKTAEPVSAKRLAKMVEMLEPGR